MRQMQSAQEQVLFGPNPELLVAAVMQCSLRYPERLTHVCDIQWLPEMFLPELVQSLHNCEVLTLSRPVLSQFDS